MTLRDAIVRLQEMEHRWGSAIEVYFDCPICSKSFTPDLLVPVVQIKATVKPHAG